MRHMTMLAMILGLGGGAALLTGCGSEEGTLPPTEKVQDVDDAANPEESVIDTPAPDVDAPQAENNAVPADSLEEGPTAAEEMAN